MNRLKPLGWLLLLSGCAFQPAALSPPPDLRPLLTATPPAPVRGGGVFRPASTQALTSNNRAFRVGDVLTVILDETTQASKAAGTAFGKNASARADAAVIAGRKLDGSLSLNGKRQFNGSSSSVQENMLTGAITVVVHQVLSNGLLMIQGEKQLSLNQGEEFVRLAGYIRGEDLDAENRISSQRVANARISYAGSGTLADANQAGWLMRFFTSPLMPY